jgi:protein-tyrosine sulfotransferase
MYNLENDFGDALPKEEHKYVEEAMKRFVLEVIEKHGPIARRLCNKDPFALKYMKDLAKWYPNSKFIYMIRDGRSVAHSIITRKITITGYDLTSYPDVIGRWDQANSIMWEQCKSLGPQYCMPVHYEHLVLEKEVVLRAIGMVEI